MNKKLLFFAIFISTFSFAQQEIKLDIANALVLKTIHVSYERYISEQTSFGGSVLYSFEEKTASFRYNEKFMLTPYLRHYFTSSENLNFFGEAFFGFSSGYKEIDQNGRPNTYEDYTDGALGIAGGAKYVASGGLVIDVFAGLGRNLFSANSPVLVPRIGANIGWQF